MCSIKGIGKGIGLDPGAGPPRIKHCRVGWGYVSIVKNIWEKCDFPMTPCSCVICLFF